MKGIRLCDLSRQFINCAVVVLWLVLTSLGQQNAVVPGQVNFSGTLTDTNGKLLSSVAGVTFALYKDQQGGSPLWMETQNVHPDKNGHYTVMLGSTTSQGVPPNLFAAGEARWLGVQPQGQEEQPRVMLMSVPYALKALDAETIGGKPASSFMLAPRGGASANANNLPPGAITGSGTKNFVPRFTGATTIGNSDVFEAPTGNVGIGTTTPGSKVDVNGTGDFRDTVTLFPTGTHPTLSVHGTVFAVSHTGEVTFVAGQKFPGTGTITGVTAGIDLTGGGTSGKVTLNLDTTKVPQLSTANTFSANQTVHGTLAATSFSGNGANVTNVNAAELGGLAAGAFARLGANNTFTGNQTVTGNLSATNEVSAGSTPTGNVASGTVEVDAAAINKGSWSPALNFGGGGEVIASNRAGSSNQYGLDFFTNYTPRLSVTNTGLVGIGVQSPGWMLEVDPPNDSGISGPALFGANDTGSGNGATYGLYAAGGYDITNISFNSAGLGGFIVGGSSNVGYGGDGVDAWAGTGALANGYAGYFNGDVNVTGQIFAGTKDFKIDHPLDPANKYLVHASVESSEMMNIYTGNITTDAQGEATVQLPDWLEALNTDFRYQLTVIGQFAQAIIAHKIENHQFTIRTSVPNLEVSWQVTGVRQDAYAKAHPLVVEQEKETRVRGFYIHPELYGAPAEKQIEWARHPQMMKQAKERKTARPAVKGATLTQSQQPSK